jgi:hypothetical protein
MEQPCSFRPYLLDYYPPHNLSAIPNLLGHAYDLAAYHLNVFYNAALYWPQTLNPLLIPLVLICVAGWGMAFAGRYGDRARHLALLGMAAVIAPAVLSVAGVYPFGGVRQSLFLAPFFFAFAALGFYGLRSYPAARLIAVAVACCYVGLWAANLPRFYNDRLPRYTPQELVAAWQENGNLPVYARECERELRYALRDHPEMQVSTLGEDPKPPYLVISTHNWIGDNRWYAGFPEYLKRAGYTAVLLKQAEPTNLQARSQSLYFPPNGLWIYKVMAQ